MSSFSEETVRLTPSQVRSLSLVLREVNRLSRVSIEQLIQTHSGVKPDVARNAVALLVDLGILTRTKDRPSRYTLGGQDTVTVRDFIVLKMLKKARVSSNGNRAVRVRAQLMALRDGVTARPCGSMMWSHKVRAPKYRLGPAHRVDPLSEKKPATQEFEVLKREKNDMVFRLSFGPPLSAGEVVDYGFYIWTQKYYALTRTEALERYKDEWTREGLSVNDATLHMGITVGLPDGFKYQEAKVEKNPVLTPDGPNVPGTTVSTFKPDQKALTFTTEKPSTGHYFVSWKPPE